MADEVLVETEGLRAAVPAWRTDVPKAVAYELPTSVQDAASTAVVAAMADWPAQHAAMAAHREAAASALVTATNATIGILTAADAEGAAEIAALKEA